MKGLELSKRFYLECGKDALEKELPQVADRVAIGLAGEGSECFGFDDIFSTDHDFEPAFCMWIERNDYEKYGFELEKFYSHLPREFEGYTRKLISPVGGKRHGVICIEDFFLRFLGTPHAPSSDEQWLYLPSFSLACSCNGEIFCDRLGRFSTIREQIKAGYPIDIKLKKLAGHILMMSQAGLYNYPRSIKRGENGAAQLAIFEFVRHTISTIYLLNNVFEPFYKWVYRGMRELSRLGSLENSLIALTELGNSSAEAEAKRECIEEICKEISTELSAQGLISSPKGELEAQAYMIQNKIQSHTLRNMHIMSGI